MKAAQEGPLQVVPEKNTVIEILGRVAAEGADLRGDIGADNNTRWVFDVDAVEAGSFTVQLLNYRGRPAATDIEPSFHLTPLSGSFYDSKVWGETRKTVLTLHVGAPCRFRVDVDIIGTNRR